MTKRIIYIFSCLCISLISSSQIGAQTCSPNFTVSTQIKNSTCLSNGEITVTLGGDTTNIFNVQYGLSSESGFSINPQSDHVLRNIPPGTYKLTVQAFCKIDNEYNTVKSLSNLVVGGNYKVLEVSLNSDVSRKSYIGCGTGIIALNVTNGSGNFEFTITSAPAGVATPQTVTPTKSGNVYTFPNKNYPAGNYTVQVSDGCYTSVRDFTLGTISGFPTFSDLTRSAFRPDLDNTQGSCGYVKWTASSNEILTNLDYKRYYNDRMYEIGAAPAGQIPTQWSDWNSTASGGMLLNISPYNIAHFYSSNSLAIYIRLKGCNDIYKSFTTSIKKPTYFTYSMRDRNCNNYTYTVRPWTDYDGLFCYPLNIVVKKTTGGDIVYNNPNWLYSVNSNDIVTLEYDTQYTVSCTDQNGTVVTSSMSAINRNISFLTNRFDCDSYQLVYYLPTGTHKCIPVEVTITDPNNVVVCTQTLTNTASNYSCPLEYGKTYTFTAVYADGFTYTTTRNIASTLPTSYALSTSNWYDDKCTVDKGRLYISANAGWPIGTTLTITGPTGYVTQSATMTSSSASYTMPATNLPSGTYTLTVNHGCGNPIVSTFNNPGIYNYKDLGYTNQQTCSGMKITPTGTITYKGNSTTTYYRLTSGPTGYDKTVIAPGGTFTFSAPGTYVLGILTDNNSTACVIGDTTIVYTAPPLDLDPKATSAYVCVGGTTGNISVKAMNGVAPYTYQLWNADNTVKISGVADITTSGTAHFTYGLADETYTIRINDQCGNAFKQQIMISNLETAKIVYASSNPICTGGTIQLKCIILGSTNYTWTGPNGFTSDMQNPTISNVDTNMTGWYKVSVTPEFCGIAKLDSIHVTVIPPLLPTPSTADQSLEVCVREQVTLTAEVTGGEGFYTYQWQSSTDGISWFNIAGAVSASYIPPTQIRSGTYYYRRITTDTSCGIAYNRVTLNIKGCYILVNPNIRSKIERRKDGSF